MKIAMRRLTVALGLTTGVVVIAIAARRSSASLPASSAPPLLTAAVAAASSVPSSTSGVDWTRVRSAILAAAAAPAPATSGPTPADAEPPGDPKFEAFRAQVAELNQQCALTDACDSRQLLLDQAGLAFDFKLGPNHPARKRLVAVIGWSFDEREALGNKFKNQDIDRRRLFALARSDGRPRVVRRPASRATRGGVATLWSSAALRANSLTP